MKKFSFAGGHFAHLWRRQGTEYFPALGHDVFMWEARCGKKIPAKDAKKPRGKDCAVCKAAKVAGRSA